MRYDAAVKRLLITGASGLLGSNLMPLARQRFETLGLRGGFKAQSVGTTLELNLTDTAQVDEVVRGFCPEIIVHAAAMTAPDECEKRPEEATRINVGTTRQLAALAAELRARFLFISTDLVFDGHKGMYREEDAVNPQSHYARTKVEAERVTLERTPHSLIIRASLMVGRGARGNRSVNEVMKQALDHGETMQLFTDEYRSLIGTRNLAEAILELAERNETGLLHLSGPERRSRHEWGVLIARHFGWDATKIQPAKRADYRCNPPRPPDVSLDISKAQRILKTRIKPIEEVLHDIIQ